MRKCVLSTMLAMTVLFSAITIPCNVKAEVPETESVIVSMEEAKKYAVEHAAEYIATFLGLTTAGYAELSSSEEFYLGDGYDTYTYSDDVLTKNSVICFPIIQNDAVVMELYVDYVEEEWTGTGSTELAEILSQNYHNTQAVVYCNGEAYIITDDGIICRGDSSEALDYDDVVSQLAQLEGNTVSLYDAEDNGNVNLGYVENPLGEAMTLGYTPGFSVNETNYKILEMAYCLVDQNGPDGKPVDGLCWASSAVSIIRYRSGRYRNLQPYFIASVFGKTYEEGAGTDDILAAMKKYLTVEQLNNYKSVLRTASSMTEVQHNINNGFPISMAVQYRILGVPLDGHVVTLIGYNVDQLIYWDSALLQCKTTPYSKSNTSIVNEGKSYIWTTSVLIPLS